MTANNRPAVKLIGDPTAEWKFELRNFPELDKALGRDVLNALCRCFVHADRLTSMTSGTYASERYHGPESTAYRRDHMSMFWFTIGTLRELASAIEAARSALAKRGWLEPNSEHWATLRKLEERWEKDEFFRRVRNVAAFHVDEAVIDRGLNELAKDRVVDLAEGQSAKNIDSMFSLGALALFHGLEISLDDYGAFVQMVTSDHVVAVEAIQIAFVCAAEAAGILQE